MKNTTAVACRRRRLLLGGLLMSPLLRAFAAADAKGSAMHDHGHHHDHHAPVADDVRRSEARYRIPALKLVRQDGSSVDFAKELEGAGPVVLNFIYTSCTAICPMTSQIFSQVQSRLEAEQRSATLVSISIDPEYDTPPRLAEYAKRFGAGSRWQFYTGTQAASVAVQKAFDAYRGDKMNHTPVTFLRAAPNKPWVRLDGFAGPDAVLREYRTLMAAA